MLTCARVVNEQKRDSIRAERLGTMDPSLLRGSSFLLLLINFVVTVVVYCCCLLLLLLRRYVQKFSQSLTNRHT